MDLQSIKKEFFVFRNGIVADTLRKAGMPHKVIFGLQIPQIAAIAKDLTPSSELAEALWNDSEVRESRILATYLFPVDEMSLEKAIWLLGSVRTQEESDMLAFRLIKRLHFASEILKEAEKDPGIPEYAVASLRNHLS